MSWECAICHEKFDEHKELSKHRQDLDHYKAPRKKGWKCIVHVACAMTFPTREQRDDHHAECHHHECDHPGCNDVWFNTKSKLMAHQRKHHQNDESLVKIRATKIQKFTQAMWAMDWDGVDLLNRLQPGNKVSIIKYFHCFDKLEGRSHPEQAWQDWMGTSEKEFIEQLADDPHFKTTLAAKFEEEIRKRLVTMPLKDFIKAHGSYMGASDRNWKCRAFEHYKNTQYRFNSYLKEERNACGEVFFVKIKFRNFMCPLIERVMRLVYENRGEYVSPDRSSLVKDQMGFLKTEKEETGYVYRFFFAKKYIPLMRIIPTARKYVQDRMSWDNARKEAKKLGFDTFDGESYYHIKVDEWEYSEASHDLLESIMGVMRKKLRRHLRGDDV